MNDQLALGVVWREVGDRTALSPINQGGEPGDTLAAVARGIAEDVSTFEAIIERLETPPICRSASRTSTSTG